MALGLGLGLGLGSGLGMRQRRAPVRLQRNGLTLEHAARRWAHGVTPVDLGGGVRRKMCGGGGSIHIPRHVQRTWLGLGLGLE